MRGWIVSWLVWAVAMLAPAAQAQVAPARVS